MKLKVFFQSRVLITNLSSDVYHLNTGKPKLQSKAEIERKAKRMSKIKENVEEPETPADLTESPKTLFVAGGTIYQIDFHSWEIDSRIFIKWQQSNKNHPNNVNIFIKMIFIDETPSKDLFKMKLPITVVREKTGTFLKNLFEIHKGHSRQYSVSHHNDFSMNWELSIQCNMKKCMFNTILKIWQ